MPTASVRDSQHVPYLLCGEVQGGALAVVRLVDRGSGLQQNLCTVQAVSQHTVHQRGPAKLVLTVPQRGISYRTHTQIQIYINTHTRQKEEGLSQSFNREDLCQYRLISFGLTYEHIRIMWLTINKKT